MIKLDKMTEKDLPQIQELYKELVSDGCSLLTLSKNLKANEENPAYLFLTARKNEEILGTAIGILCFALDTPFLVVENVVVKEKYRGTGVGRMMFQKLDDFALEHGCGYSILISSGFRTTAHHFYEAVGYVDDVRGFRKVYC